MQIIGRTGLPIWLMSDQGTQSTAGLTVKRDKCEFGVKEIAYLCHKIGSGQREAIHTAVNEY